MLAAPTISPREMPESKQRVHTRIIDAINDVPAGRTASYGGIARAAGVPGRARLVGWVLRHAEMDLPWHRIVRADGRSAFAEGSSEWREQRARLASEGLLPGSHGAYPLATGDGASDLDALLWRPAISGKSGSGTRAGRGPRSRPDPGPCRH